MAKFFVSYSRSVKNDVKEVVELLRSSGHEVWWDGDIPIMADWWATILKNIEWCDTFIFVTSEKSVQSAYCIAELKYANDRQRPILPFILDDPTQYNLPSELPSRAQWLMYDGDPAQMLSQINYAVSEINLALHKDLNIPRPPEPMTGGRSLAKQFQEARQLANKGEFEESKKLLRNIKTLDYGEWGDECDNWLEQLSRYEAIIDLADHEATHKRANEHWQTYLHDYGRDFDPQNIDTKLSGSKASSNIPFVPIIGVVVVLIFIGLALTNQPNETIMTPQAVADETKTPTIIEEPTDTPDVAQAAQTLIAEQTAQQIINNATATASQKTLETQQTLTQQSIETATATVWTKTPTPDLTASVAALLTEWAEGTLTQQSIDSTATAILWTATPTATFTPSDTPTHTPTATFTPTLTVTPTLSPEDITKIPVVSNKDWTPAEQDFDGVTMVLVPVGCFMMGSDDGDSDEVPVHEQCIEEPFWIDKYEVSNEQYGSTGCTDYSSEPNQPRNCVSWFDAKAFCESRGGRLPTEKEWEYAARGPDNLIYPWGNGWDENKAVFSGNAGNQTAEVGSRAEGASWVGAMDMSGNVWEWVSSLYGDYPYGNLYEIDDDSTNYRVLRGESFSGRGSYLRGANRYRSFPDFNYSLNHFGFRCARS